jgi:hypothetical protein
MSAIQTRPRTVGRPVRIAIGLALAAAALAWAQPAKSQAATTCTWAGTPLAPTGTFTIDPGITNFPAATPLKFVATGALTGDDARCHGQTMKWVGQIDAGSTCLLANFEGTIRGLAGVASFWGRGSLDVPSYLYDSAGNLVGVEDAQIVTQENAPHYTDCTTPSGFTRANFSSVVVLF